MYTVNQHEKELWEKVKPYLDKDGLREDAPPDVIAADKELEKLAWEDWNQ